MTVDEALKGFQDLSAKGLGNTPVMVWYPADFAEGRVETRPAKVMISDTSGIVIVVDQSGGKLVLH